MAGRDIKAGAAYVEIYLKTAKFNRGMQAASRRLSSFGRSATMLGTAMLGTATAMSAPLVAGIRVFANFDDQMRETAGLLKRPGEAASMLEGNLERLTNKAEELGRAMSFTATEVAAGMTELARMGLDTDQIDESITGVMNLARATRSEVPEAALLASRTLKAFGLDASEMERVVDVLAATVNQSGTNFEALGDTMKYIAPLARVAGMSLEDTAAIIGALADAGEVGSRAGTSLRAMLVKLAGNAGESASALEDIDIEAMGESFARGFDVEDIEGNLLPVMDIMRDLGEQMKEMGSAEQIAFLADIFGRRPITAAAILGLSEGQQGAAALAEELENAGGTAARTADMMDAGLGGMFRLLTSDIEAVGIAIGKAIEEHLQEALEWTRLIIDAVIEWIGENGELVITIGLIAAGLGTAGAALIAMGIAATGLSMALGVISGIVSAMAAAAGVIVGIFTAPISLSALAIAGVVALGVAILYYSGAADAAIDGLVNQFNKLGEEVQIAWGGIADAMAAGNLDLAMEIITAEMDLIWTTFYESLKYGVGEAIKLVISLAEVINSVFGVIGLALEIPALAVFERDLDAIVDKTVKRDELLTRAAEERAAAELAAHRKAHPEIAAQEEADAARGLADVAQMEANAAQSEALALRDQLIAARGREASLQEDIARQRTTQAGPQADPVKIEEARGLLAREEAAYRSRAAQLSREGRSEEELIGALSNYAHRVIFAQEQLKKLTDLQNLVESAKAAEEASSLALVSATEERIRLESEMNPALQENIDSLQSVADTARETADGLQDVADGLSGAAETITESGAAIAAPLKSIGDIMQEATREISAAMDEMSIPTVGEAEKAASEKKQKGAKGSGFDARRAIEDIDIYRDEIEAALRVLEEDEARLGMDIGTATSLVESMLGTHNSIEEAIEAYEEKNDIYARMAIEQIEEYRNEIEVALGIMDQYREDFGLDLGTAQDLVDSMLGGHHSIANALADPEFNEIAREQVEIYRDEIEAALRMLAKDRINFGLDTGTAQSLIDSMLGSHSSIDEALAAYGAMLEDGKGKKQKGAKGPGFGIPDTTGLTDAASQAALAAAEAQSPTGLSRIMEDLQTRIADATEETAKNTLRMIGLLESTGLVYD